MSLLDDLSRCRRCGGNMVASGYKEEKLGVCLACGSDNLPPAAKPSGQVHGTGYEFARSYYNDGPRAEVFLAYERLSSIRNRDDDEALVLGNDTLSPKERFARQLLESVPLSDQGVYYLSKLLVDEHPDTDYESLLTDSAGEEN